MPKITKHAEGRFVTTIQINGTRKYIYGETEKEVKQKYKAAQREIAQYGLADPSTRTVNDLCDQWMASIQDLKPRSIENYDEVCRRFIRPQLGRIRLSKCTPDIVQRFYNDLQATGLKRFPQRTHRALHRAFHFATLWRWVNENPCKRVVPPKYEPAEKVMWNQEQVELFIGSTADCTLHNLWVFIMATGCRMGEINALRWDHIQEGRAIIDVSNQRMRNQGWVETTPKSRASKRAIVIPTKGMDALERQRVLNANARRGPAFHDQGYVFPGRTGGPLDKSYVDHKTRAVCVELGLPPLTPHGMRHLHATYLIDQGVPVPAVSARLGHSSPAVTMRIYAHALTVQDTIAAEAINKIL
jgi:integrase